MKADKPLPYPVLSLSDDITPSLDENSITINHERDATIHTFTIRTHFENSEIEQLIAKGKAEYTCEIQCPKTMLRLSKKSCKPDFSFTIQRTHVAGKIEINCFVTAKALISGYTNKGFNSDYDGFTFDLEPGDVLVMFPPCSYNVSINYDKLQSAGSFMNISCDNYAKEVYFYLEGDKINIRMPKTLYELYHNPVVKTDAAIIHSSLVVNALTYALMNIEKYPDTLWAQTIKYRHDTEQELKQFDLQDYSRAPSLAQALLKNPYQRLFSHMINTSN